MKGLISKGNFDIALNEMKIHFEKVKLKNRSKEILVLQARFRNLYKQYYKDVSLTQEDYSVELNKLSIGIIEILHEFDSVE